MQSFDIKRGLSAAAVAALVITGLPALTGSAYAADGVGSVSITPSDTQTKRPGQSTDTFGVTVLAPDGSPVEGETVTLSVDSGYFTPLANLPEVPEDQGQTITVTTDQDGIASFKIAIGRDTGFDDDGQVISTITATAGGISDTEDQLFVSSEPLNGSEVDLVQFGSVVADSASFDVMAYDEFGNPVEGETVTLTDDSDHVTTPASAVSVLQPVGSFDVVADGGVQATPTITASWVKTQRGSAEPFVFTDSETVPLNVPEPVTPAIALKGRNNGASDDRLVVDGSRIIAGEQVRVVRLRKGKRNLVVGQGVADARGNLRLTVKDANGRKLSMYRAAVGGTDEHTRAVSNRRRVR
ncbi:hypothetical protein BH09ACT12_BH09ACT12_24960 [soil metagenome]